MTHTGLCKDFFFACVITNINILFHKLPTQEDWKVSRKGGCALFWFEAWCVVLFAKDEGAKAVVTSYAGEMI